jgi:hypothetical protein
MRISCYGCGGSGWTCDKYQGHPGEHDRCEERRTACPSCGRSNGSPGTLPRVAAPYPPPTVRRVETGAFQDSFDYETLWRLLARIGDSHRFVRFADLVDDQPRDPFCLLRHDVDYTLYAALALAREEAARGIRATYFLLVNSAYYNLLSPSHAHVPAAIAGLGHEVGLHYDVRLLRHFAREQWDTLLETQVALLEALSGQSVKSIAMHQPALNAEDPFHDTPRYLNAYADRFTKQMAYVSDSCRAWPNTAWRTLTAGPLPDRLQLALHPINWAEDDRDRLTIFRDLHVALANAVLGEGDELLVKIAVHAAVAEHNARTAGS